MPSIDAAGDTTPPGDTKPSPGAASYEQAFQYFKLGRASAAVVVFFALIVGLTLLQWLFFRHRLHYTT